MQAMVSGLASYIKPYIVHVAFVMVTCGLVVLETYIHATVKRVIRPYHFVLRVAIYVFMFAFVYGFLVTYFGPRLARILMSLSDGVLLSTLIAVFVVFGYLIERK
jgi:hypothetical protein